MSSMFFSRRLLMPSLGLCLASAVGCQPDPAPMEPAQVSQTSAVRAAALVRAAGKSIDFLGAQDSLMRKLDAPLGARTSGGVVQMMQTMARVHPPLRSLLGHPEKRGTLAGQVVFQTLDEDTTPAETADRVAGDLEVMLRDRILAPANIEQRSDGRITYLLRPDPTCRPVPSEGNPASAELDPACVHDLQTTPVRVVVSGDGDGVRLQVLLGDVRAELFAFVVQSKRLALELDLPQTRRAVEVASGQSSDEVMRLEGKVRVWLEQTGEARVAMGTDVLAPIAVEFLDDEGVPLAFSTEARTPLASVAVDGTQKTVTLTQNLGKTRLEGPWDPEETGAVNRDLRMELGGLTGQMVLRDGQHELSIQGLGLGQGPSRLSVRGKSVFAVDVNAQDGRRFDLLLKETPDGQMAIQIAPRLELTAAVNLAELAAEQGETAPPELADEVYTLRLDGARPVALETVDADAGFPGGLRMVAGALSFGAQKAGVTVQVPQGQCVVGVEPSQGQHAIVNALAAQTCPNPTR